MTVTANSSGVATGKFTIPAGIPAGIKNVVFAGAGGSRASASFFGQGEFIEDIRTVVTQITETRWDPPPLDPMPTFPMAEPADPLAQTFILDKSAQIEAVELFFSAVGSTTVAVQIRETQVGFPTRRVVADTRVAASGITAGAWNRFSFLTPAALDADTEYAIVVLCNDAISELAVAELGKFDAPSQQWVTSQPYTVGVLLSSSNAITWTAHQDRDMAFRLVAKGYTESERVIDLGSVTVTDATELLLMTMIESPDSAATGEIELTLPDGSILRAGDNQRVTFPSLTTGAVGVKARLRANDTASAVIYPGTQIVQGRSQETGTYISNAVDGDAAGCTVKVVYDAVIPSGASVVAEVSGVDSGDTWLPVTPIGVPKLVDGNVGLYEYQFQRLAVEEARVRARLTLNGTVSARPRVRNLRVIVL